MGFHSKLVQVIKVGVILSAIMAAAITAFPIALPNCPDSCGNVKIPSPFGTTEGCYLNDTAVDGDYFIKCTSNAYGQPQQMIWNINVISISMELVRLTSRCITPLTVTTSMVCNCRITTHRPGSPVSQFLSPKTSSWQLGVTLTYTLMVF